MFQFRPINNIFQTLLLLYIVTENQNFILLTPVTENFQLQSSHSKNQ